MSPWMPRVLQDSDPLAGIDFSARWQSHRGNDVPLGFYSDDAGTIPAVEFDAVAAWRDYGNLRMATQGDPDKRPLLMFDGNGHPYLDFDGIDDVLDVPSGTTSEATALTGVVVFAHTNSPPASGNDCGVLDNWGSGVDEDHLPYTSGIYYHGFGSTERKNGISSAVPVDVPCVAMFTSAAFDWKMYFNGTQVHSTATNGVGVGALPKIGGTNSLRPSGAATTPRFLLGRVYSVLCMKSIATEPEREAINSYLASLVS